VDLRPSIIPSVSLVGQQESSARDCSDEAWKRVTESSHQVHRLSAGSLSQAGLRRSEPFVSVYRESLMERSKDRQALVPAADESI